MAGGKDRVVDTNEFIIVIDTREQRPYQYEGSVVRTLTNGDYSALGFEDRVAVERKSLADAYASLGRDRVRFRREVERLAKYEFAAIVIEASLPDFLRRPLHSQMNPRAAITTLLSWAVRYHVHVFFAGDRAHGQALTQRLLETYWKYREEVQGGRLQ